MYEYQIVTNPDDESLRQKVLSFWLNHNALDKNKAKERLDEVIGLITDQQGEILGVGTAKEIYLKDFRNYFVFVRLYVAQKGIGWRMVSFFNKLVDYIFEVHTTKYPKSVGVFVTAQNAKLNRKWKQAVCPNTGFIYLGNSSGGSQMRVKYFDLALLNESGK